MLRAYDSCELCPPALEPFLAFDLLALGRFLEVRVDPRSLGLQELELCEAALVVDRDGGAVMDGPLDVVHADVVAEDGPGVRIGLLERRPGEPDEGRMWQGVAHVPGEAIDEVVLATVSLIGNDHDVAT